jgi:hypothetical protein
MLESLTSYTGWGLMTIVGPIVIAAGLIYGIVRASSRRKLTPSERAAQDRKTEELYQNDERRNG